MLSMVGFSPLASDEDIFWSGSRNAHSITGSFRSRSEGEKAGKAGGIRAVLDASVFQSLRKSGEDQSSQVRLQPAPSS